ncbi:MAG: phycobilisome protein [Leptolyngbyaceae bacterium]|nr:phycobilisome protein [Leptolyngbyaceae bacterium]
MNSVLERNIAEADGRYLSNTELSPLEEYTKTYRVRLQTYCLLQAYSQQLILKTLQRLMQTDKPVVEQYGDKCQRDMGYVMLSISNSILKDDENAFREQLILWMQNIMSALRKEAQSARAYRLLQAVVTESLPAENAKLINRHLDSFIDALTSVVS